MKKGVLSKNWSTTPTLKKGLKNEQTALLIFAKELRQNLEQLQKHGLFFTFNSDPFLTETSALTWRAVGHAITQKVPCKILTKRHEFADIILQGLNESESIVPTWAKEEALKYIAFGFTLTGHDELEPNASPNIERIKAMRMLHKAGFKTFASIEPIVDIESSKEMIRQTAGYCDLYKIGLMSGKKYDKKELVAFIDYCNSAYMTNDKAGFYTQKNYFKDSLLKQAGIDRKDLPKNCVERDYNIFNI